jgi:hypothetical protein
MSSRAMCSTPGYGDVGRGKHLVGARLQKPSWIPDMVRYRPLGLSRGSHHVPCAQVDPAWGENIVS